MPAALDGQVVSLHITSAGSQEMSSPDSVTAVPGKGLEGDRYLLGTGFYSEKPDTGREITLIEEETLAALGTEQGIEFDGAETRRNVVTRGVALNGLAGQEFMVGEVRLKGVRLCVPCQHLVEMTGKAVLKPLLERGGLRADILSAGTIRVGDKVTSV
ncbi:MAG: hypothetical protein O7G32_12470 [SAR324 cluster bacterium]|nr:hypothetical protein [SAR324 cluster bacterium]